MPHAQGNLDLNKTQSIGLKREGKSSAILSKRELILETTFVVIGEIGSNGDLGNLLSEHDAMAVRRHDCELTHSPRFVFQLMPYFYSLLQDLLIETRNVADMKIRKPRMILALGHWLSRGAVANSNGTAVHGSLDS